MFGFSDLAALCGPNHVPMIATDEETVARTSETHSKIFFTFAPPFQEVTEYCIPAQATILHLFTGVRGREILRTSPFINSPKLRSSLFPISLALSYNTAVLTNPALHEVVGAFPSTNASAHATQRSLASPGAQPRGAGFAARTEEAALLT
jgi:hypothetical protein